MIPIVYEKTETAFSSNGLGRLRDVVAAEVTEERNGVYELSLTVPVDGANYDLIKPGRFIGVTHDDTGDVQPFYVVGWSRPINGLVTFHAVHLSYRLTGVTVWGKNINSLTAAFNLFRGVSGTRFRYVEGFTSSGYMAAGDGVPRTVRQMIGGVEGSVLDTYGGELEWDRWTVKLHKARGTARDLVIRYGVNLLDYQEDTDYLGAFNSCIPYWVGMDGAKNVVVRGSRVDSGSTSYSGYRIVAPLDLTDKFEEKPTAAQLESMAATVMAAQHPALPAQTIAVDFFRLQDTPEFENFAALLECRLCDTIRVEFPRYNMSGAFKIVKVVWDVLAERYSSMELGTLGTSLAEALGISTTAESISSTDDLGVAGDLAVAGNIAGAGTIRASGHIYAEGNGTWIGYQTDAFETTQNMASGSSWITTGQTISLSKGTWLVEGEIAFNSNSTGRRGACVHIPSGVLVKSQHTEQAVNGAATRIATSACVVLTGNSNTTVAIYGFQTSGGQLSATTTIQATRIA